MRLSLTQIILLYELEKQGGFKAGDQRGIERAKAINANADLIEWIERVRVFGSYNSDAADLGDIDLVIDTAHRCLEGKTWSEASRERAPRGSSLSIELSYGRTQVMRLLKKRNPYLSFHLARDLEVLNVTNARVLYEREQPVPIAPPPVTS